MNPDPDRDLALINTAGFLRSFGVGLMGVVLGIYFYRIGLSYSFSAAAAWRGRKSDYDLLLYRSFRLLKAPEERMPPAEPDSVN